MSEVCPNCKSDLRSEPIPEKYFVHHLESDPSWDRTIHTSHEKQIAEWGRCHCLPYGDREPEDRFFSRMMGYEIQGVYDGILFWGCPDCGHLWPRFAKETWGDLHTKAAQEIQRIQDARLAGHLAAAGGS